MRGKASGNSVPEWDLGITPAYAGKRPCSTTLQKSFEDHPRLCGEKPSSGSDIKIILGSPPPMRGKGFSSSGIAETGRITPAYAGKSFFF